jgi:nicotinamidase-related amidase
MINRNGQQNSIKTLDNFDKICKLIDNLPVVKLNDFNLKETAIIIIDMIEGFVRTGPLASPRVATIIPKIISLTMTSSNRGIPIIAFADTHTNASPEFESFPSHCLQGTIESELIKELKIIEGIKVIPKNSINGAITTEFNLYFIRRTSSIQ